jgi:adenosylcobinamide-GDP ribazoletransferase
MTIPPLPPMRDDWRPWAAERGRELKACLLFLTRIPLLRVPAAEGAASPELAKTSWAFPLAGVVVGGVGAIVYALAHRLGLPPWPAAALAVTATLALTGALHEDGLADTLDGFGGGDTREQKLDIMHDARIGAFGVCALVVSLLIRVAALASLADNGLVAAALIAAHASGRAAMAPAMFFLPPARADGLSFSAGQPPAIAAIVACLLAFVVALFCLGFAHAIEAAIVLAILVALVARLAAAQIGGQTGDVLGAVEQVCEIAVLLVAVR